MSPVKVRPAFVNHMGEIYIQMFEDRTILREITKYFMSLYTLDDKDENSRLLKDT